MAQKTITCDRTLHIPGSKFVPFEYDINGAHAKGKYDVQEVLPGMEVTLDADEADDYIAKFGGKVIAVIPDEEPAVASAGNKEQATSDKKTAASPATAVKK